MAGTLADLAKNMRELAASIPAKANLIKQTAARTINFDLLQVTPVDIGDAVSNWQVQLDTPADGPRAAFVPSPGGRMVQKNGGRIWEHRADPEATRQANIEPALSVGNAVIDSSKPGQSIHITNVLPYIQALDEGHSSQAINFVERAIILGRETVTRAKITSWDV